MGVFDSIKKGKIGVEVREQGFKSEKKGVRGDEETPVVFKFRKVLQAASMGSLFEAGVEDDDMFMRKRHFYSGNKEDVLFLGIRDKGVIAGDDVVVRDREDIESQLGPAVNDVPGGIMDIVPRIFGRMDMKIGF